MEENKVIEQAQDTEKFNWHDLLYYIENKNVVPIIGSGLYQVKEDYTGNDVLLYQHMHKELCKQLPEEQRDDDYWEFMQKNKTTIPTRIRDFFNNKNVQSRFNKSPLLKLAQITDFQYYVCMTYENYFESILMEYRCKEEDYIETINFSVNNYAIAENPNKPEPVASIYNLMGNISKLNGFAKTEEEVLEHLYALTEHKPPTDKLFNNINEKHLLFIGCNLSNWLLRFLIRILTQERLNEANITKIIADRTTANDKKLCLFLNHFNSNIYPVPNSTALEFVDELYIRWSEKHKTGKENFKYKGSVFLSFSSEDRATFVEKLYNELKIRGVNVFYDKEKLDAGDYFNQIIKKAITHCSLFIPLISEHSLDPERYALREWDTAMNAEQYYINAGMKKMEDASFIKPFIIDNTKPNDPRIGNTFKHISAQAENDIGKIVQQIIANLKTYE